MSNGWNRFAKNIKLYDKGSQLLLMEAIAHNTEALRGGKVMERLPIMLKKLQNTSPLSSRFV